MVTLRTKEEIGQMIYRIDNVCEILEKLDSKELVHDLTGFQQGLLYCLGIGGDINDILEKIESLG